MKFVSAMTSKDLEGARLIAESNDFAIFDARDDTYALVWHQTAAPWRAVIVPADGIFRMLELG